MHSHGNLLAKAKPDEIERLGLGRKFVKNLAKNKVSLLESLKRKGFITFKGREAVNWYKIVQGVVALTGARIDTVVSPDIHRLIRLPGTLHRKTGFMKVETTVDGLPDFDPLKKAVAFNSGQMTISIPQTPEFRVGEASYGPFKAVESVELPTAAALFLLCKGAARVVD